MDLVRKELTMSKIQFGIFDHIERRGETLDGLFEGRLELLRDYDAAGFFCYHVAEHHATPLGMGIACDSWTAIRSAKPPATSRQLPAWMPGAILPSVKCSHSE